MLSVTSENACRCIDNIRIIPPLPPYVVFCFGITYDCVKRVQASNNTLLDKPVNGVACPNNVESEAPNMRIDIQKRNMQQ